MEAIEKIDFEKVGKRMKKLRKEQRISQDQVAKDLGATISFVSNIENNYTRYDSKCKPQFDVFPNLWYNATRKLFFFEVSLCSRSSGSGTIRILPTR